MKLNDPKIGTEHIFLSILNEEDLYRKHFSAIGINYETFLNEIIDIRSEDFNKLDDSLAAQISGFKTKTNSKKFLEGQNKLAFGTLQYPHWFCRIAQPGFSQT